MLEAKAAAERDASKDTTEPLWFCLGGTLPFALFYGFLGEQMILNPSEFTGLITDEMERAYAVSVF